MAAASLLHRYFGSGWAFLVPYLAAYLLYRWLKWPVNPSTGAGGAGSLALGTWNLEPSLLHVFWMLHAVNVVLAAVALIEWLRMMPQNGDATPPSRFIPSGDGVVAAPSALPAEIPDPPAAHDGDDCEPVSAFGFQLSALLPWLLLALLFYLPGVYLEWPSDPWAHYGRINEWSTLQLISAHSAWSKSSYFLAYSLVGQIAPPTRQLFWLDLYYTAVCLLLCWQYFRLVRSIGLSERAAMLFVVLQAVLFGNNIFGFYRYYGISSSLFAQIGAVALVRVAIEFASAKLQIPNPKSQKGSAGTLQEEIEGTEDNFQGRGPKSTEGAGVFSPTNAHESIRIEVNPLSSLPSVRSSRGIAKGAEGTSTETRVVSQKETDATEGLATRGAEGSDGLSALAFKLKALSVALRAFIRPNRLGRSVAPSTSASSAISVLRSGSVRSHNPSMPAAHDSLRVSTSAGLLPPASCLLRTAACAALLVTLIAFNHPQGLGIAGLGLLAVAVWRLVEWRRSTIWWMLSAAIVLSVVAVLWFPRHPAIGQLYRPDGWLTAWYGFNVFAFSLPVGDRTLQIVGLFGLANLAAGLMLLRRNHIAGWLTITPLLALSLPFVAIPLTNALAQHNDPSNIVTFQRMLFAIPPGLALVALLEGKFRVPGPKSQGAAADASPNGTTEMESAAAGAGLGVGSFVGFSISRFPLFLLFILSLAALLLVPAKSPGYNRFWQACSVPPGDLCMTPVVETLDNPVFRLRWHENHASPPTLTTYGQGAAAVATGLTNLDFGYRNGWTNFKDVPWPYGLVARIAEIGEKGGSAWVLVPPTTALSSPYSLAGRLSGHWLPQAASLEYTAAPEVEKAVRQYGGRTLVNGPPAIYLLGNDRPPLGH